MSNDVFLLGATWVVAAQFIVDGQRMALLMQREHRCTLDPRGRDRWPAGYMLLTAMDFVATIATVGSTFYAGAAFVC